MSKSLNAQTEIFDPLSLIEKLDVVALRARIAQLDRERKALVILIRSASRRANPSPARKQRKGVQP